MSDRSFCPFFRRCASEDDTSFDLVPERKEGWAFGGASRGSETAVSAWLLEKLRSRAELMLLLSRTTPYEHRKTLMEIYCCYFQFNSPNLHIINWDVLRRRRFFFHGRGPAGRFRNPAYVFTWAGCPSGIFKWGDEICAGINDCHWG